MLNCVENNVNTHDNLHHSRSNRSKHKQITWRGIAIENCFRCNKNKNINKSPLNWVLHWKPCQQITWHGSEIDYCLQKSVNRHESQLQKWQVCDKQTTTVTSKRSKTISAWYLTSHLKQTPLASKQSQTKKVHKPDILSYNTMSEHVAQTVAAI